MSPVHMTMGGWGVAGGAVPDLEDVVVTPLHEIGVIDYVMVPRDVLSPPFVLQAVLLARYYAGELGIAMPGVYFFAEAPPDFQAPWLDALEPAKRAAQFFRSDRFFGAALDGNIALSVGLERSRRRLVQTVAHEVAHLAGYNEREAGHFGDSALVRADEGG